MLSPNACDGRLAELERLGPAAGQLDQRPLALRACPGCPARRPPRRPAAGTYSAARTASSAPLQVVDLLRPGRSDSASQLSAAAACCCRSADENQLPRRQARQPLDLPLDRLRRCADGRRPSASGSRAAICSGPRELAGPGDHPHRQLGRAAVVAELLQQAGRRSAVPSDGIDQGQLVVGRRERLRISSRPVTAVSTSYPSADQVAGQPSRLSPCSARPPAPGARRRCRRRTPAPRGT